MRHEAGPEAQFQSEPQRRAARACAPIFGPISAITMTTMTTKTSRRAAEVM